MLVIALLAPICRLNTADEIVAGKLRLAKMKVMVNAAKGRKRGDFSLESKVRRTESLIPGSLWARWCASWMKNLSSASILPMPVLRWSLSPPQSALGRVALALFSFPVAKKDVSLPSRWRLNSTERCRGVGDSTETYFAVESNDYIGTFIHVVEMSIPSLTVTLLREAI